MLVHRPRRWNNIKKTLAQRLQFAGLSPRCVHVVKTGMWVQVHLHNKRSPNAVSMLAHRRRWCASIETALGDIFCSSKHDMFI